MAKMDKHKFSALQRKKRMLEELASCDILCEKCKSDIVKQVTLLDAEIKLAIEDCSGVII